MICEYLDDRLAPSVARDVRQHLDRCKDCRVVLDAARSTLEIYFGEGPKHHRVRKQQVA